MDDLERTRTINICDRIADARKVLGELRDRPPAVGSALATLGVALNSAEKMLDADRDRREAEAVAAKRAAASPPPPAPMVTRGEGLRDRLGNKGEGS
jgi:hypothetical protein